MKILINILIITSVACAGQLISFIGQTNVGIQKANNSTIFRGLAYQTKSSGNSIKENLPVYWELRQNYPNPFNPTTQISYSLPNSSLVKIKVYNINGCEVAILVDGEKSKGNYSTDFNGSKLASGLYYYTMEIDGKSQFVKKMILIK